MAEVLVTTRDLRKVARDLRRHADGKAIATRMRAELRAVTKPLVPKVRAAYKAAPGGTVSPIASRARHGSLRALLAKATRLEVKSSGPRTGARIRVSGSRMPSGMGVLPKRFEGKGIWFHPLFGNPRHVYVQAPHPTFYRTVVPYGQQVGEAMDGIVRDVVNEIARG